MTKIREAGALMIVGYVVIFIGMCLLGISVSQQHDKDEDDKCEPKIMIVRPQPAPTPNVPVAPEKIEEVQPPAEDSSWWKFW